ncbi:MAG: divergent PAP2 family protein [Nitrosarchaeum sp.]|nr:divergent PAP2 family protein [Nitrosarchaeum sp.]
MNTILLSSITALIIAQIIKILLDCLSKRRLTLGMFAAYGGMPSMHSALLAALTSGIYLEQGLSTLFAATLIVSLILIRDARVVRTHLSDASKRINTLQNRNDLNENLGHKTLEILIGIAIGLASTAILYGIKI